MRFFSPSLPHFFFAFYLCALLSVFSALSPAFAQSSGPLSFSKESLERLTLGKVSFASGTVIPLDYGIGSGAFRREGDPEGQFYTISDRGPALACKELKKRINMSAKKLCKGNKDGKLFLLQEYVPSIFVFQLEGSELVLKQRLPLTTRSGAPLSGLYPPLPSLAKDKAYSLRGQEIKPDINGINAEALVRMADGSFWVGEEYGPSLLHISAKGLLLRRVVPKGLGRYFKGADYAISESLPAILAKRAPNRGVEALALSPDQSALYFILQSPLANPGEKVFKNARAVRLFKLDARTGKSQGEYVYLLDKPKSFKADAKKKKRKQKDVKLSEMVAIGPDRLILLERIDRSNKLYQVTLEASATNILGSKWDDISTSPSLEERKPSKLELNPLKKVALDFDATTPLPRKIEAMALVGHQDVILISDNDFSIDGEATQAIRLSFSVKGQ